MNCHAFKIRFVIMTLYFLTASGAAADEPTAAFLYAYNIKDDARADFEIGYKQHLAWHVEKKDHLVWYAWTVVSGPNVGMFIDGTFGATLAEIDARPDLAGDGANFAKTSAPHADAAWYASYRRLPEASSSRTLEDRQPSPVLDAYYVSVKPASMTAFERALADISSKEEGRGVAWYRAALGGDAASYLALAPRRTWADLEGYDSLRGLFARSNGPADSKAIARAVDLVASATSEIWLYRSDLSYFPGAPAGSE